MQVTKTFASCKVFDYISFTHTNKVFLFRHLLTEFVIFRDVCHQMKGVSLVIVFPFSETCFANISPTFLISCEVQTRYSETLKNFEQYIRDHLSGTKVRVRICSEYNAVFNFSWIALCKLTKSFFFSFI